MVIKRRHGPDRDIAIVPLGRCEICQGEGIIKGVFHRMPCAACHGSGLVHRETGETISPAALVVQLRLRLNHAMRQLRVYEQVRPGGPGADYGGMSNKRHAGGGNWTGD